MTSQVGVYSGKDRKDVLFSVFSFYQAKEVFMFARATMVLCIDPLSKKTEWVTNCMDAEYFYSTEGC